MKTKNVTVQESVPSSTRYFYGRSLQDLMFEVTQMFMPDLHFNPNDLQEVKIIPVHPKQFKLGWDFYEDGVKICTIRYEAQDEKNGNNNVCWLDWYDTYGCSFRDLYEGTFGIPEWVETDEDEDLFFEAA